MRFRWLSLFSLLVLLGCAPNNPTWGKVESNSKDEVMAVRAINGQVQTAVKNKHFAALNSIANEFRTRRSRSPSGIWNLTWYYRAIALALPIEKEGDECLDNRASFIRDWIKATPAEPTPYIAQAEEFIELGKCFRGNGFAREVSSDSFAELARNISKAKEVLTSHRGLASTDPQFYAAMVTIYKYQGKSKTAMKALIEEAIKREPYYYDIYREATYYYMPRWFGSPGELEWLGRLAAMRTADGEGMEAYARVFWALDDTTNPDFSKMDWPTAKQGMRDILRVYPSDWNAISFARLSCIMKDRDAAASFFDMAGLDYTSAWRGEEERLACRTFANRLHTPDGT